MLGYSVFSAPPSSEPSGWTLGSSWTWSSDVDSVNFTGLGSYNEIMAVARSITSSMAGGRQLLISSDAGVTWIGDTSGDFIAIDGGTESNTTGPAFNSTATTSAVSGVIYFRLWNKAGYKKVVEIVNRSLTRFTNTTAALNSLRLIPQVGNLTGGSLEIWGR